MAEHVSDSAADAPTLPDLFLAFVAVSLSGFGGTLPWAYRMVVEKRRWMTATEFSEVFSLCQFLPGANVVNFSVVFGSRARGVPGALVCFSGLVGAPVLHRAGARGALRAIRRRRGAWTHPWRHGGGSLRAHRRHSGKAGRAVSALPGLLGLRHRAGRHPRHRSRS